VCEGFYCVTVYVYLSVCLLWATMPEIKWLDWKIARNSMGSRSQFWWSCPYWWLRGV